MKTPSSSKEISKTWLEYVLGEHLAKTRPDATLTVNSFTVAKGTKPGDGFNSELVVVDVQVSVEESGSSLTTDDKIIYHLVAKFLSVDVANREINRRLKTNVREHLIYTQLIRDLNEFQAVRAPEEPKISIPELIYGKCTDKGFVLLMENLKALGYETNDKFKGLDFHHLKVAVDQIARIHALSYAYGQSCDFQKKFTCIQSTSEHIKTFRIIGSVLVDSCTEFLKSLGNRKDLVKRIEMSKESFINRYLTSLPEEEGNISCLNHGDFWNNNFLFRYKEPTPGQTQQEIEGIKIIDWGASTWGNPTFDLQYLMHTSTTVAVRQAHVEQLLQQHHSTFTMLATKMGSPPTCWNFDRFMSDWRKTYPIGFTLGCALTQGTLSTSNPANRVPEPSVLDKAACFPVRVAVDGLKLGMAKLLTPLMFKPSCESLMTKLFRQMCKPILAEMASGKNEVLNTRLLDLIIEADENGLFTPDSE